MKVAIDPELCIGCGICAQSAPDIFRMEDDKAVVIDASPETGPDSVRDTASQCPTSAITVEE